MGLMVLLFFLFVGMPAQTCVECHKKLTPGIVKDWELSKHSKNDIECSTCHGENHTTNTDTVYAMIPTPGVCGHCHEERVEEFKKGKHALAWAAMKSNAYSTYASNGID